MTIIRSGLTFLSLLICTVLWGQEPIKVMSYNIRIASPPSKGWGITEIDSIAAVINRSKPDLVALQEVDVRTSRSGKELDQAQKLGELTGMHAFFSKAVDRSEGDYGVAILSRFPVVRADAYRIYSPDSTLNENRALAVVEVKLEGGALIFASFHLDHLNDTVRDFQLDQILKHLKKYKNKPILMGADLNMDKRSRLFTKIADQGLHILENNRKSLTFPNDKPKTTLDYFLFNTSFQKRFKELDFMVLTAESYASDHLPIILNLNHKQTNEQY
ncbi:endonuclease/exonuclease/phosphatase family protein [Sphingobacterium sp. SYP-B4668]|uniref:endonuclease/exonuclease/phosphatase family protein n=1 Tax=Sphingobacterium sp. SYP-B4668 TaxID=2996035 RepID=UPI0022DD96B5|nr:endonuclease/exonuclease/phosphatase family protein [Sphingobacterium sp. SYP-B4668]